MDLGRGGAGLAVLLSECLSVASTASEVLSSSSISELYSRVCVHRDLFIHSPFDGHVVFPGFDYYE